MKIFIQPKPSHRVSSYNYRKNIAVNSQLFFILADTAQSSQAKSVKVRIDGFRLGEYSGHGPQGWQVKAPVM
jgi:hypothetical protein